MIFLIYTILVILQQFKGKTICYIITTIRFITKTLMSTQHGVYSFPLDCVIIYMTFLKQELPQNRKPH